MRRLFWRAGFGATPEQAAAFARRGKASTIAWLVHGGRGPELVGPPPNVAGRPLDPVNEWGHPALWWLDRMVRTQRPLVERMTLFWHDHFATRDQEAPLMLRQNRTLRRHALGSFPRLLTAMTADPALQLFLSLADSDKAAPNENYARELMELFTLGRGYHERDVRQVARALTGFRSRWTNSGFGGIHYDRHAHDAGRKRIFGHRGRYDWHDVIRLVTSHPRHAPFLVGKLWDHFVTSPLDRRTRAKLVRVYLHSGRRIGPLVGSILAQPALYAELGNPGMVKSPLVFLAGSLRQTGRYVDVDSWAWLLDQMGQAPFYPPSVAGWDWGPAWLSTNTMKARFSAVNYLLMRAPLKVEDGATPPGLTPEEQVERARAATGRPWTSPQTDAALLELAASSFAGLKPADGRRQYRADACQRALRHLLLSGPDAQLS